MKIKLFEDMIANGQSCKQGDTVEVTDRDAKYLIANGRAEAVKQATKPAAKAKPTAKK